MTLQGYIRLLFIVVILAFCALMSLATFACVHVAFVRWPVTKRNNKTGKRAREDVRLMIACAVGFLAAMMVSLYAFWQAVHEWELV